MDFYRIPWLIHGLGYIGFLGSSEQEQPEISLNGFFTRMKIIQILSCLY